MERTAVNPVGWGANFMMHQGEVITGATRTLHCSGQVALEEDANAPMGLSVVGAGDMRRQMQVALAALDDILAGADMDRSNVVNLRFLTTDVDAFLEHYEVYAEWISKAGTMPTQTLVGVSRLVDPELMVEIEMTASA